MNRNQQLTRLHPCKYIWATTRQNVSSDQVRLKLACSAIKASYSLEILAIESTDIILSKQRTRKALIRLRQCTGWSAPLLFAYDIRHIFSWPGSLHFIIKHAEKSYVTMKQKQYISSLPGSNTHCIYTCTKSLNRLVMLLFGPCGNAPVIW